MSNTEDTFVYILHLLNLFILGVFIPGISIVTLFFGEKIAGMGSSIFIGIEDIAPGIADNYYKRGNYEKAAGIYHFYLSIEKNDGRREQRLYECLEKLNRSDDIPVIKEKLDRYRSMRITWISRENLFPFITETLLILMVIGVLVLKFYFDLF
ncbi:MAG: hypothetical protein ACTSW1_02560 [Candidatus Hodarchaeales archaeon]